MTKKHSPLPYYQTFDFGKEIIVDGFAGGGGASTGIEMALGVSPDVAINHDYEAIAMHMANHPRTHHYTSDIFEVDPLIVTMGRPVGLAWFSPDCKHHSKAKGGKPKDKKIRSLAWVAVKWAKAVKPRVIMLENVEEFKDWCPLDRNGHAIINKKGETFMKFVKALEDQGYQVEYRQLRACDYGAPTIRKRLFLIARCDGRPIVWPQPTHAKANSPEVKSGKLKPWRSAAEIIDWSVPTYSIFLTKEEARRYNVRRPLAAKTMERIARGFDKFVLKSEQPYIIDKKLSPFISTYYGKSGNENSVRGQQVDEPIATITAGGGRHALVTPFIAKHYTGVVGHGMDDPIGTITTADHHSLIAPFVAKGYSSNNNQSVNAGQSIDDPLHTITTRNNLGLVTPYISQMNNHSIGCKLDGPMTAITSSNKHAICTPHIIAIDNQSSSGTWSIASPLSTITAKARHCVVASFLHKYYGTEERQSIDDPLHTITTKDRFGLVEIKGEKYRVIDIGFRMLTVRELYKAQGFPEDYQIDVRMPNGKNLTKTAQVRMVGNSVVPLLAKALVEANYEIEMFEDAI